MALTKADMAEKLFEDLGLNKREAKELVEMFFPVSEISICARKTSDPAAIPRQARRFRFPRVAS
jgi:hypothetical protein